MSSKTKKLLGNLTASRDSDSSQEQIEANQNNESLEIKDSNEKAGEISPANLIPEDITPEIIPVALPSVPVKKTKAPIVVSQAPIESMVKANAITAQEQKSVVLTASNNKTSNTIRLPYDKKEFIEALVLHKHMEGDVKYSQIKALCEAISLLEEKYPVDELKKPPQR